jgi:uncharacterized protein YdeI (YjbR/CyaY-like superfamily)
MKTFHPQTLNDWHEWLQKNAASEKEIWLVFYKPKSGHAGITYEEAVEEAICFGWVDSLIKNLDEISHARKFTPRKPGSLWSELNIARAQRMLQAGRMTEDGLRLFQDSETHRANDGQSRKNLMELWREELIPLLPEEVRGLFLMRSPSHQRQYAGWVMSAKRNETRQKRIEELNSMLLKGEELGLK